ncbi:hypothetical protein FQN50_006436 [Emmonsiellopsis sp. PD_5]|nr:hypothetical protein FQN50_006436 [Emmonsiellopsis sp. PD_5]
MESHWLMKKSHVFDNEQSSHLVSMASRLFGKWKEKPPPSPGWLVATLGSKSTAKKVNRKAILDVDVPKACGTIMHPEAPMALRLQGNLLYGVSRVYNQQCGYALMDAQTMRDRMRTMLKEIRSTGLDPNAGKAKRDQLIIPDDPSFIPSLMLPGLNVDLSVLEHSLELGSPRKSSLLSSQIMLSSNANINATPSSINLPLNVSSSSVIGGINMGSIGIGSELSSVTKKDKHIELPAGYEPEHGLLEPQGFEFDEEGNIVELPVRQTPQGRGVGVSGGSEFGGNGGVRAQAGEELEGYQGQFDDDNMIIDDIMHMENNDEAHAGFDAEDSFPHRVGTILDDPDYAPVIEAESEAHETQRPTRKRTVKALGFDDPPELRNSDLAQWNSEYAQNMAAAAKLKHNNRLITLAKKNAAAWVMGVRIGPGIDVGLGGFEYEHPLDMFSGERILAALTGKKIRGGRRKRGRGEVEDVDGDVDADDEERRVRMREDQDDEIGRGDGMDLDDGYIGGFDHQEDIELARDAPAPLYEDGSSHMPWDLTASIQRSQQGSSVRSRAPFLPSIGGYSSQFGTGPHSITSGGPDGVFGRRTGRMTSASPLAGRGNNMPMVGHNDDDDEGDFDLSNLDDDGHSVAHSSRRDGRGNNNNHNESFEIYGPAAWVDTQTAAESQWLAQALDQQSINFLDFVRARIHERDDQDPAAATTTAPAGEVSFSALLPPAENSRIVATQGLLHTLTLATKGVLRVRQEDSVRYEDGREEFGEIFMGLV